MGNQICVSLQHQNQNKSINFFTPDKPFVSNFQNYSRQENFEDHQQKLEKTFQKLKTYELKNASKNIFSEFSIERNQQMLISNLQTKHQQDTFDKQLLTPITFSTICSIDQIEISTEQYEIAEDKTVQQKYPFFQSEEQLPLNEQALSCRLNQIHYNQTKVIDIQKSQFIRIKKMDISKDYLFKEKIGEGAYGQVFHCVCLRSGKQRAIKALKRGLLMNPKLKEQFMQEFNILKKVDHPNVIKIIEIYQYSGCTYIVTEFCKGDSLQAYIRNQFKFSAEIAKQILTQLFKAVTYLNLHNIVHRDVKPQNIVFANQINESSTVNDVDIRIIDFGLAVQEKEKVFKDWAQIGTLSFMAPEVFDGIYSNKSDTWACAVIMHMLLIGYNPFKGNQPQEVKHNVISYVPNPYSGLWKSMRLEDKMLILKMLEVNYITRIDTQQALKHPYFEQEIKLNYRDEIALKLTTYYRGSNLVSAIEGYLAFISLSQQKLKYLADVFKFIDMANTGVISLINLQKFLSLSGIQKEEAAKIFSELDKNRSGKIDFVEFVSAMQNRKNLFSDVLLNEAFQYIDLNKSGFIQKEELKYFLKSLQKLEIEQLFQQINLAKNEKISFQQFKSYLQQERWLRI